MKTLFFYEGTLVQIFCKKIFDNLKWRLILISCPCIHRYTGHLVLIYLPKRFFIVQDDLEWKVASIGRKTKQKRTRHVLQFSLLKRNRQYYKLFPRKFISTHPMKLNRSFSIYKNSDLAPKLGNIKQKKSHQGWVMDNLFILLYSPRLGATLEFCLNSSLHVSRNVLFL